MDNQAATNRLAVGQNARVPALGSRALGIVGAAVLMAAAANSFLKYLWWTACYSAWTGIPKLAAQWRAAGARVSMYGWSLIVLELASVAVVFSVIRSRQAGHSFGNAGRLAVSLMITVAGTGLLALALSVIKQGR